MWSNGCSFQFKNKIPWYFVNRYPYLTCGYTMFWSFFSIGHGKRPNDGVGVVLKRFIRHKWLDSNGPKLQNAKDVINLLQEHLPSKPKTSYFGVRSAVTCVFWHVRTFDDNC